MTTLNVELPDPLMEMLGQLEQPPERAVLEMIVFELHRRALLSGGRGAELLGLDRREFIRRADALGIPYFNYDEAEAAKEIAASREL